MSNFAALHWLECSLCVDLWQGDGNLCVHRVPTPHMLAGYSSYTKWIISRRFLIVIAIYHNISDCVSNKTVTSKSRYTYCSLMSLFLFLLVISITTKMFKMPCPSENRCFSKFTSNVRLQIYLPFRSCLKFRFK